MRVEDVGKSECHPVMGLDRGCALTGNGADFRLVFDREKACKAIKNRRVSV